MLFCKHLLQSDDRVCFSELLSLSLSLCVVECAVCVYGIPLGSPPLPLTLKQTPGGSSWESTVMSLSDCQKEREGDSLGLWRLPWGQSNSSRCTERCSFTRKQTVEERKELGKIFCAPFGTNFPVRVLAWLFLQSSLFNYLQGYIKEK